MPSDDFKSRPRASDAECEFVTIEGIASSDACA
jgi:hypothetical protein